MTLWAKILAGALAALAVVGVGVYVAMPASGGCPGTQCAATAEPLPSEGCCSAKLSMGVSAATDACQGTECPGDVGCCKGGSKISTDALAACGSGLTAAIESKTKIPHCCAE
ncbi:MAG: hypothetical protein MUF18_03730 [Fimbriiglobus sp.]|jgi:hypothetical protein|nr:hypothetical protein [Fimbriiglobus sp.]